MKRILLLILLLSPLLYGATPHNGTIYVWGYMDIMENILQSIKGMVMEMGGLTKIALGVSLLIFTIKKAIDSKINPVMELAKLTMLFMIVSYAFLQAPNDDKHRFVIEDEATGELRAVSQIPIGIGKTLSLITTVEREIAHLMEKHFSTPNSLQFSKSGFGYSLRTHFTNANMTSIDGFYLQTFKDYFKNCVQVDLITRQKPITDLAHSYDLASDLFDNKRTLFTFIYDKTHTNGDIKECREVAQYLKSNLPNQVMQVEAMAANMNGETIEHYRNNANGVVQLFFKSNQSSREYLQQMVLINMTNEAIINSAKAVGLDPAAKAWGSAVANYNLTQQMQAQGQLAQTYLPKAKAYFTVIVVAVTCLIALLSILFGDYIYIKTLFILNLWLMFWTPILIVINYFNDLNLEGLFKHIQIAGQQGLSYVSNQIILQKMIENSNFINYMVMTTPILAYAIVKASEHGFVSLATSLSQSMQGAARANATEMSKQAMDMKPSIRQGNDVYADNMGQIQVSTATLTNSGINFSTLHTAGGTRTLRDDNANNTATVDSSGRIINASIEGVNANTMQQETKTRQDSLANSIASTYKDGTIRNMTADLTRNKNASEEDAKAMEKATSEALTQAYIESEMKSKKKTYNDVLQDMFTVSAKAGGGKGIFGLGGGGDLSWGMTLNNVDDYMKNMSKNEQAEFLKSYAEKLSHSIKSNDGTASAFANSLSTMQGNEYSEAKQAAQAYTEAKTHSQSFSVSDMPRVVENYMQAKGLHGDSGIMQAQRDIQQAAASGNMSDVMSYAGMDSSQPSANGLKAPSGSQYNPQGVVLESNLNNEVALQQSKNNENSINKNTMKDTYNQENENKQEELINKGNRAKGAVEHQLKYDSARKTLFTQATTHTPSNEKPSVLIERASEKSEAQGKNQHIQGGTIQD